MNKPAFREALKDTFWWLVEVVTVITLVSLLVLASQATASAEAGGWGMTVSEYIQGDPTQKLYYTIGVTDTAVLAGMDCLKRPTYGQVIAWTEEKIWEKDAIHRRADRPVAELMLEGLGAHGCTIK